MPLSDVTMPKLYIKIIFKSSIGKIGTILPPINCESVCLLVLMLDRYTNRAIKTPMAAGVYKPKEANSIIGAATPQA